MLPAPDIVAEALDAVSASLPQFVRNVAFYGERPASAEATARLARPDSSAPPDVRKIALTVKCMVTEDVPLPDADATAPTTERVFKIIFPDSAWLNPSPPQIGEWVRFDPFGSQSPIWGKVTSATRMPNGDHKLTASHLPKYANMP